MLIRALWWAAVWSEVKEEGGYPRPGDMSATQWPAAALATLAHDARPSNTARAPHKP